jgi:hypothetical protein
MSKQQWRGAVNQKRGYITEELAHAQLERLGVHMVDKLHTGWRLVRWIDRRRKLAQVAPHVKVRGDHTGILKGGRRVLAETKSHDGDTLPFGTLKKHQHAALTENAQLGGLSLVVWITDTLWVMDYSLLVADGWEKYKSIDADRAARCEWRGVRD